MQNGLSWDDLKIFLAVERAGSFVAASRVIGVDHTTIARRITTLEGELGQPLFLRSPRGVTLTSAGAGLTGFAERMEREALLAADNMRDSAGLTGVVRLATPEAFGTFLVAPNVPAFARAHPELQLDLVPESRLISLINREADMAVALTRPPRGRLAARLLTDYQIGLFASRDYVVEHGMIESPEQLAGQPFATYIDELIAIPQLDYFREAAGDVRVIFRSSSIAAQQAAVAAGIGLGLLHVFAAEDDPNLVRLLPEIQVTRSYWLVVHEDNRRSPRIRAVGDFLDTLVKARRGRM